MEYPQMLNVKSRFRSPSVSDIAGVIKKEWNRVSRTKFVKKGDRVAITIGSRGITDIQKIAREIGRICLSLGAKPFVVPAMGSHGGSTAAGQTDILKNLGISEDSLGFPIISSMEVDEIGVIDHKYLLNIDHQAWNADHIIVVGRVKPHTDYNGRIESGLIKMMVIGLGNHKGASIVHKAFKTMGFEQALKAAGDIILKSDKILGGFAILENHYHGTAHIEGIDPEHIYSRETELLKLARQWMPGLPLKQIDLLIIDEIGKEISGTGMDTNVVGRKHLIHDVPSQNTPSIRRIYVRDLTDASNGNATGIGLADYTHKRLVEKIDLLKTYHNCNSADNPRAAAIPMHFSCDKEAVDVVLGSIGEMDSGDAKIVWIRNTLDLSTFSVSACCKSELQENEDIEIESTYRPLQFDSRGELQSHFL